MCDKRCCSKKQSLKIPLRFFFKEVSTVDINILFVEEKEILQKLVEIEKEFESINELKGM